jgi:hypothetical protein
MMTLPGIFCTNTLNIKSKLLAAVVKIIRIPSRCGGRI